MPPTNPYGSFVNDPSAPGTDAFPITPSDSADLQSIVRSIYVGTAGHIKVRTEAGTDLVYKNVPAGGVLDTTRFARVYSTGTTAADLIGGM